MMGDLNGQIKEAREAAREATTRYWETKSVEFSLSGLLPYLAEDNVAAMHAAASILGAAERVEEASVYCRKILQRAASDEDYVEIMGACEVGMFDILPEGRDDIYKRAMHALAERGNWVVQTELALNYKNGKRGFPKDEALFLQWIEAAAGSGEFDPVAHYVEYLVKNARPIPQDLHSWIEGNMKSHPMYGRFSRFLANANRNGPQQDGSRNADVG